MTNISSGNT